MVKFISIISLMLTSILMTSFAYANEWIIVSNNFSGYDFYSDLGNIFDGGINGQK